ncbi:MAG: hypothetical protein PHY09_03245 [Desulfuromonadaceae bacterium]|nr:hypothetical protein [Desulfuromonadaceae bacterium]MDD5104510.1 hypothetical protein [Desulfuromonadaceae bacterium]
MTTEVINKFFLDALNYAINQFVTDGSPPALAVLMTTNGEYAGCTLQFTNAKSKSEAIATFVSELKEQKPPCAVVIVPISASAGRGRKRKTSLCVAFQSSRNKFVSIVDYKKSKNGEFEFETPYFCDDNEIILSGHEYFGDAFD